MKGVVFNIFEAFVVEGWGDEAYEALLDACPMHNGGVFAGPESYPDEDLVALLTAACTRFGVEPTDALRAFGRFMFGQLASKFPAFLENHDAKSFLMSIHDVIHVEVRKLMPGAVTPSFSYHDPGGDQLVIEYRSERKLCFLMEGLLQGVGEHYGVTIAIDHSTCMHEGADHCTFELEFVAAAVA